MSYLGVAKKCYLLMGLGNRRSVAWAVGQVLEAEGAQVIYGVRDAARQTELSKLLDGRASVCCDVEDAAALASLPGQLAALGVQALDGFVHSIAYARYSDGLVPFHATQRGDFLQAVQVSAFSLVELANTLKPLLTPTASVVTIGISSYVMAASYGYMSPIKQCLEGCVRFLAKSFSADSEVRFNSVNAGPLRTKSSAGIPGYLENYLFAEKLTLRKRALETREVADSVVWLLSPRSSGINAQGIVVNAGMDLNYFDEAVVKAANRTDD